MIVCVCARVSESDIIKKLSQGDNQDTIQKNMNVCEKCKCCQKMFETICQNFSTNRLTPDH
jgi:bacterioferritin-associated ferredoxin